MNNSLIMAPTVNLLSNFNVVKIENAKLETENHQIDVWGIEKVPSCWWPMYKNISYR